MMIAAKAYAKLNLTLEVLGKRPDGYHEIDTVMTTLDLADRIAIRSVGRVYASAEASKGSLSRSGTRCRPGRSR